MIAALVLLLIGLMLSAFFSGSETGFYRVARVRLVLDALEGNRIAKGLWWLTNRPSLFVATTLVGNNLANYVVSLSIVMAAAKLTLGGHLVELLAPLLLSPLVFVYGELLPKQLFFEAPYRLLRMGGLFFLACTIIFLPFSLLLWGLSKILERLAGRSPEQVQLTLARRELQTVLEEGHEAGVLRPAQRQLAGGLIAAANQPVMSFATSPSRIAHVRLGTKKTEVLRLARRQNLAALPVEEPLGRRKLIGYVRVADLKIEPGEEIRDIRQLVEVRRQEPYIAALVRLHESGEQMARVVDDQGETVGLVTSRNLIEPLFQGGI